MQEDNIFSTIYNTILCKPKQIRFNYSALKHSINWNGREQIKDWSRLFVLLLQELELRKFFHKIYHVCFALL